MPINYATPDNTAVNALSVALAMHADLDTAFHNVKYPDLDWPKVVSNPQIKEDVNAGAVTYAYRSRDSQGTAAFVSQGRVSDIPQVSQSMGLVNVPLAAAAIGSTVTNEDARQHRFGMGGSLADDLGQVMRKGADNLVERVLFYGDEGLGWSGLLDAPGMAVENAPEGASGQSAWADKTPEEVAADINRLLTGIWSDSKQVYKPQTLFLPPLAFAHISTMPMTINGNNLALTILEYIREKNVITAQTGQPLDIKVIRHLAGAGIGGVDRMIAQDRDPEHQILPFPLRFTLTDPVAVPLGAEVYAEFKFGPYHMRHPGASRAMDGI